MTKPDARRHLPQIDALAREIAADTTLPRAIVVDAIRTVVEAARRRARKTKTIPGSDELVAMARAELTRREASRLRPVINATGVILHTNLGRAPLSARAIEAVAEVASGYSNLEWDAEHGRRGDRHSHVEPLLSVLLGAEAALVVNNNAAAVLLVCAALGHGREVVISRGELIEIGGEFRIPDVLAQSGARLREVGTTNRTRVADYERAIGENTAFVLKVHPSNYRVVGFTASPSVADLSALTRKRKVPLVYDVGSGLVSRELADEPTADGALSEGADLVCFSGDKLFGGPQAGIVAGSADLVSQLRTHPLLRALRPDKMQIAALGATVTAHLNGVIDEIPVWQMIDADGGSIARRSKRLVKSLRDAGYEAECVEGESVTGGGSLPGAGIATKIVRAKHESLSAKQVATSLRTNDPPIVVRVEDAALLLDLRTVLPGQDHALTESLLRQR